MPYSQDMVGTSRACVCESTRMWKASDRSPQAHQISTYEPSLGLVSANTSVSKRFPHPENQELRRGTQRPEGGHKMDTQSHNNASPPGTEETRFLFWWFSSCQKSIPAGERPEFSSASFSITHGVHGPPGSRSPTLISLCREQLALVEVEG